MLAALAVCWGSTAIVDAVRLTDGPAALGYLNFLAVWTIPAVLGVAYAKRILRPGLAVLAVIGAIVSVTRGSRSGGRRR